MEKMIEVKNVSMRFNMTGDKINSLKEFFVQFVTKKNQTQKSSGL